MCASTRTCRSTGCRPASAEARAADGLHPQRHRHDVRLIPKPFTAATFVQGICNARGGWSFARELDTTASSLLINYAGTRKAPHKKGAGGGEIGVAPSPP